MSTWHSVHPGVCLLGFCPLGSLAAWHSAHVGLCPLLVLSTLDSAHAWFCLLGSLSTWNFIYFDSVHSKVCPHDELWTKDWVHSWFCLNWILLTFRSVYLAVCPGGCLPTLILSAWESGLVTFCPRRIVFTIGSVNSGFYSIFVPSSWEYFQLDVCLLQYCPLGNMCTCYSVNWGLFQGLVVFTLDSAPSWFCLLGIMSIQDFF